MADSSGKQKGAQDHAEGEHGPRTREEIVRELESGRHEEPRGERPEDEVERPGKHRLEEGRAQHDEADLNAEKTRRRKLEREDRGRSEHELRGGDAHHPALPNEEG